MRELRPHLASIDEFVARVNGPQRAEGYSAAESWPATPWLSALDAADELAGYFFGCSW